MKVNKWILILSVMLTGCNCSQKNVSMVKPSIVTTSTDKPFDDLYSEFYSNNVMYSVKFDSIKNSIAIMSYKNIVDSFSSASLVLDGYSINLIKDTLFIEYHDNKKMLIYKSKLFNNRTIEIITDSINQDCC